MKIAPLTLEIQLIIRTANPLHLNLLSELEDETLLLNFNQSSQSPRKNLSIRFSSFLTEIG